MITQPQDAPVVLKLDRSDPIKLYVLHQLGHPHVKVELSDDQLESAIRTTCDFITGYFPREQRLASFYTTPLQSTYPLPSDAYWVVEVQWDPFAASIDDLFGMAPVLMCLSPDFKVLAKDGSLQPLGGWEKHWRVQTPYGPSQLLVKKRENERALPKVRIEYDGGIVEATSNHILEVNGDWAEFHQAEAGHSLAGLSGSRIIQSTSTFESTDAVAAKAVGAGCYYGCLEGEPVLIH